MVDTKHKRPFVIILILIIENMFVLWSILSLISTIQNWNMLVEYTSFPLYFLISRGLWLFLMAIITVGVWMRKKWAWLGTIIGFLIYGLWYWSNRIFVQTNHANWPFSTGFTIFLLLVFPFLFFNQKTRYYFFARK